MPRNLWFVFLPIALLAGCAQPSSAPEKSESAAHVDESPAPPRFRIRGVLPWHNFLSGPSAWNLDDYERYLDTCRTHGINLVAFHNYTGGGERYVTYVEPMIRITWRDVVPDAYFDHSLSARWGYRPLAVDEFAFGTGRLFTLPAGARAFGADVSVTSRTPEEHYAKAADLMRSVLRLAHERGIQMAMGFEFGVHPPEYLSVRLASSPHFGWNGSASFVPNPTSPEARELLYRTIDATLETYPGLDWIWLWLNEHTMFGVDAEQAVQEPRFARVFAENRPLFDGADLSASFLGVWALEYIRLAHAYIRARNPEIGIAISGWGGGDQLSPLLLGLHRALPEDIVFTSLSPNQGEMGHVPVLAEIARSRRVWAIPWLEGDRGLWHLQPRALSLAKQVDAAAADSLDGVLAIHWRTEETRTNFRTFAHFAGRPAPNDTGEQFLRRLFVEDFGEKAAALLAPTLLRMDQEQWLNGLLSEEYYSYEPTWGRMEESLRERVQQTVTLLHEARPLAENPGQADRIEWLRLELESSLLLDEVGRRMEGTYRAKQQWLAGELSTKELAARLPGLRSDLQAAPVESLFTTYASKVRSRGELGVLSALNQKLWLQYRDLLAFVDDPRFVRAGGEP